MIILANKPSGRTSNDVVQYIKHFTKSKKCGHSGTLDPMATGLMILATDDDTKKLHDLTGKDKSYIATIDLSKQSDTRDMDYREQFTQYEYDIQGCTIDGNRISRPSKEHLDKALQALRSDTGISLPLPGFSAKKVKGKKLYDLARQGTDLALSKDMVMHSITILEYAAPTIVIECEVGSGTYIRSIAHWLGLQYGLGGILTALQRTSIDIYNLNRITHPDSASKIPFQIISHE
ncbi:MAG: hypothetical protein WC004_02785 [Candidatus Absconditabacterales bacterium]